MIECAAERRKAMEEYDEDKTIFEFENEEVTLAVWIDKYGDDPAYVDDGVAPSDKRVRRNGLGCGRSFAWKNGGGYGCMFIPEFILASDVAALRDGVHDFMTGKVSRFGPFPEKDPYGGNRPFFSLTLFRGQDNQIGFSVTTDVPASEIEYVDGEMSEARLSELHDYYARLAEWFPVRIE